MKYQQDEKPTLLVREFSRAGFGEPHIAVEKVLAGLPVEEFDGLRGLLGITVEEMTALIGISPATLSRRRARQERLDRDHSDRLVRYARLYGLAISYFDGNDAAAGDWLRTGLPAFRGETPLRHAITEIGGREVEDLLGRLEFGVYA